MASVPHFDRVITELKKILAKSSNLEPDDKAKVRDALRTFELLETEYHGDDDAELEEFRVMLRLLAALQDLVERETDQATASRVAGRYELAARHEARRAAFREAILLVRRHATIERPEEQ